MLRKLTELEMEHALEKALEPYERVIITNFEQSVGLIETTMPGDFDKSYSALASPVHLSITAIAYPKMKRRWTMHEELNAAGTKVKWYHIKNAYGGLVAKFKDGETADAVFSAHNATVGEG